MIDKNRLNVRKSLIAMLLAVSAGYGILAGSFPTESMAQAVTSGQSGQLDGKHFLDANLLNAFYQSRDMRTVWLRGKTTFQPRVEGILALIEDSWTHGLNPEHYHYSRLKEMASDPNAGRHDFDMLLSDAVLRYARDLTGMRGAHRADDRAVKYWRQPMEPEVILNKIVSSADPVSSLRALAPTGKLYGALRSELIRQAALLHEPDEVVTLRLPLKPGRMDKGVPQLRARLGLPAATDSNSDLYDDALAAEVIKIQRQNGLKADGIVRADTLTVLNRSPEAKIRQILANMERLRWMEQGRPERYILVNIPSASLWAVENGAVSLEMPVIVGKTARPTYSFRTDITGVRFNPNWTVPPTIKKQDFLPMLQQDPLALTKRGIRITYQGREIDPSDVNWSSMSSRGLANLSMVQNPGDDNPLGKVRVIMENPYNIYLHDTNHPEMFENEERLLSSGCIRVSQPEKLADFILRQNEGWTWNGMLDLIDSGRMRDVKVERSIPVYITYQTIWLDSEGQLIYGRDVYGQDAKLAGILEQAGGIHIPQISDKPEISL